jgi:hypothetical protein
VPAPRSGEIRVSRRAYAMETFGVMFFGLIEGFNGDDCDSVALVLKGTCTETSLVSSARSGRLRYASGHIAALSACFGGISGRSMV